jgi:HEAT repeat protein
MATRKNDGMDALLAMLHDRAGLVRQKARRLLVEAGEGAVPGLCRVLLNSVSKDARWGAATALLDALEDRNSDVAWLAAVALKGLGREVWKPVLQRLVERGVDSVAVRDGVHHILAGQKFDRYEDLFATVVRSLEFGELDEAGSMAAAEILKRMLGDLWQECRDLREGGEAPDPPGDA